MFVKNVSHPTGIYASLLLTQDSSANNSTSRGSTCVNAAVPLQLAWFGKRLLAGVTFEYPGLLRAERRTSLVCQHVLLAEHTETSTC